MAACSTAATRCCSPRRCCNGASACCCRCRRWPASTSDPPSRRDAMNVILTNLLAFGFALGIIIVVHEAGHLLVAKAFGVRVLTFSIGFGKRLWGFARGGTDYRVSAIPLGGYVRLFGENPDESSGDPGEFLGKPRWQRVLVYLAGPAMNVVLSVVLFAVLFMVGVELPNLPAMPPLIGAV